MKDHNLFTAVMWTVVLAIFGLTGCEITPTAQYKEVVKDAEVVCAPYKGVGYPPNVTGADSNPYVSYAVRCVDGTLIERRIMRE